MGFYDLKNTWWTYAGEFVAKANPNGTINVGKRRQRETMLRWEKHHVNIQPSKLTISTGGVMFLGSHCIGVYSNDIIRIVYEPHDPKVIQLTQSMSKTLDNIRNRRMTGKYDRKRLDEVHQFLIGACGMRGIQLPK